MSHFNLQRLLCEHGVKIHQKHPDLQVQFVFGAAGFTWSKQLDVNVRRPKCYSHCTKSFYCVLCQQRMSPATQSFLLFNTLGKQEEETGHSRLVLSLQLIIHSQSRGEKRCRSVTRAFRSAAATNNCQCTGGVRRSARVFDRIGGGSSIAAEGNVNNGVREKPVVIVDCA